MAHEERPTSSSSQVPAIMQAAVVHRFGPPNELLPMTIPVPVPHSREVLIAQRAAGVGVWDAQMRDGSWQPQGPSRFPLVLGTDGAGIVVKVGSRVTDHRVGDRVYANAFGGFYAEYVAVDADRVARIPEHMNFQEAAAASVPGMTTLRGLYDKMSLSSGQTLLIFGASGAMGTLAVQFAKFAGASVIATASGKAAHDLVLELGADAVIDARSAAGLERLKDLAPEGVDAAFVLGGNSNLESYLDQVRSGGRIVFPGGVFPPPRQRGNVEVIGYNYGDASPDEFARMTRLSVQARLKVPIDCVFPLAQAAEAHTRMEQGRILGRIVLETKP